MNSTVHLPCFYISRRVEVDKKNQQHHARHLDNYGLQKTIFHVSLPLDGVGHTREGEVFEFFWRSSVLDFYWERQGGVKLWHLNGRKKPEKHMVTFTLSCTFLDPFTREKRSLFLKRRVELIIDFRSLPGHQETVSGIIVGPKNNISRTADEWYANEEHSSR